MSKSAISLSIISLLVLGGCQTTSNAWSDWEGIPYNEAVLDWQPVKPTDLYARKVTYNGAYQEGWDWGSGEIFITKAGFARYYRVDVNPVEFGDHMAVWDTFKTSGAGLKASDVKETRNKYGKFYFADLKDEDGGNCLGFMQAIKDVVPGAYEDNGKPTGFLLGYDCGDNRYTTSELLDFASNITYR